MLNQARYFNAHDFAQEIEDYWDSTEEFSRDEKNQGGFFAPVCKGFCETKRKVENMVERARTKENCTKCTDSNPSVVSTDTQRTIQVKTHSKETFVNVRAHRRKAKAKVKVRAREKSKKREPESGWYKA